MPAVVSGRLLPPSVAVLSLRVVPLETPSARLPRGKAPSVRPSRIAAGSRPDAPLPKPWSGRTDGAPRMVVDVPVSAGGATRAVCGGVRSTSGGTVGSAPLRGVSGTR